MLAVILPAAVRSSSRTAAALAVAAITVLALSPGVPPAQAQTDVTSPSAVGNLRLGGPIRHVDRSHPQATDSGSGTESAPWRMILYAVKTARAGENGWNIGSQRRGPDHGG